MSEIITLKSNIKNNNDSTVTKEKNDLKLKRYIHDGVFLILFSKDELMTCCCWLCLSVAAERHRWTGRCLTSVIHQLGYKC